MSTVTRDHLEGTSISRNGNIGYDTVEIAIVVDVAGVGEAQKIAAINDPELPAMNTRHPTLTSSYLIDKRAENFGPGKWKVFMFWKSRTFSGSGIGADDTQIQIGATATQETVDLDSSGNQVTVTNTVGGVAITQTGEFSAFLPQVTMSLTKRKNVSPLENAQDFVGKVNSGDWRMNPGASARTWLCQSIQGSSQDNGNVYTVTYEFIHATSRKNGTWDAFITWRDPNTGEVPAGLSSPAEKFIQNYKTIDFDLLELDVS